MSTQKTESRIETVDRLRRAGLWEIACEVREEDRLELRKQGLSRREAVEQSWQRMAEKFPPDTRATAAEEWLYTINVAPESCLNGPNGQQFAAVWKTFCGLMAADAFLNETDCNDEVDPIAARTCLAKLVESASNAVEKVAAIRATKSPAVFLEEVCELFGREIERLQDDGDASYLSSMLTEIPSVKERLASLQQIAD